MIMGVGRVQKGMRLVIRMMIRMETRNENEEVDACMSESEERISRCCTVLSDSPNRRGVGSACKKLNRKKNII